MAEKKDGRVSSDFYFENEQDRKGTKLYNIVDNFRTVKVSATEPTCSESGIFRKDFNFVWKICESKTKFIVT